MTFPSQPGIRIAIACGGTGGHLFPGLAVAEQLVRRDCAVTLLVSPKEIDQIALKNAASMEIATLPAVALQRGAYLPFVRGFWQSYRQATRIFKTQRPRAVLAMGGFTGAPPVLAGWRLGAQSFLHESNTIPGRANRWLAWIVDRAFVGFASAAARLDRCAVAVTGTPVRSKFQPADAGASRLALGLDPALPGPLVMGGSQGAGAINALVCQSLPQLAERFPDLQWLHLTGAGDVEKVKQAYAALHLKALVHPFFTEMELALGAATAAISRAGASSLAELAAMRVPALLLPYPAATDNHQLCNAHAFQATGAALLLEQKTATPKSLADLLAALLGRPQTRQQMQSALAKWHWPQAAERIAEAMLQAVRTQAERPIDRPRRGRSQDNAEPVEEQSNDICHALSPLAPAEPSLQSFAERMRLHFKSGS